MSSKMQSRLEMNMRELTGIDEAEVEVVEVESESVTEILPPEQEVNLPDKIKPQETLPALVDSMQEIDQDYMFARKNIRAAIEAQQQSIESLMLLAEESEKARDFEVLAEFSAQIIEANHGLLDLQLKYQKLRMNAEHDPNAPSHVTNVAYVGTAAELQALVKGRRKDNGTD